MSYKKLTIWKSAREIVIEIHHMSLSLPKHELYEVGSQISRSSKSMKTNIVEGYGRRRYKQEFIRFLVFSHSSLDETKDHLETLFDTGSLKDRILFATLMDKLEELGRRLWQFIKSVEQGHNKF